MLGSKIDCLNLNGTVKAGWPIGSQVLNTVNVPSRVAVASAQRTVWSGGVESMKRAIGETERRRAKQLAFNEEHGIVAVSIKKHIKDLIDGVCSEKTAKERSEKGAGRGRGRDAVGEGPSQAHHVPRTADARTRAQPRVRAGGAAGGHDFNVVPIQTGKR